MHPRCTIKLRPALAGLCHFAGAWSAMGVSQTGTVRTLTCIEKGQLMPGPIVTSNELWLRSTWGYDGQSDYSYSTDGKSFSPCGKRWHLTWGNYRGDRIGLFSFNNKSDSGFVDIDWFHYNFKKSAAVN